MLKITDISKEEESLLHEHRKKSETGLIRERAHAILLLCQGRSAVDVASILFVNEDTVREWIHGFKEIRIASIFPKYKGNGNASKLSSQQKKEIVETLSKPPSERGIPGAFWSVGALKTYLSAEYGVVYESDRSYHHLFAISNFSYKLPDAFDKRRNDSLVEERMQEIHTELLKYTGDEWACFAADESSIVWETELRKAWLKKGEKTIIKADRIKQRQNYFGALNLRSGQHTLVPLIWQNTTTMIEALRALTEVYPNKKLCIIGDNARWHRSKELRELLGEGKEFSHIHFIWLPPYAPDNNPQEHVWKVGKDAIANRTYSSFKELVATFEAALTGRLFHYKI